MRGTTQQSCKSFSYLQPMNTDSVHIFSWDQCGAELSKTVYKHPWCLSEAGSQFLGICLSWNEPSQTQNSLISVSPCYFCGFVEKFTRVEISSKRSYSWIPSFSHSYFKLSSDPRMCLFFKKNKKLFNFTNLNNWFFFFSGAEVQRTRNHKERKHIHLLSSFKPVMINWRPKCVYGN